MTIELYPNFFRTKVLRKRATLLTPQFHNTSEIMLPKNSMFIFQGKHDGVVGPANEELFISNYTEQVNIEFSDLFEYPIGKVRPIVFNKKKLMVDYLKGHYKYTRVRNESTALNMPKQLYVMNLSIADKGFRYVPNRFTNFEKHYNKLTTLMDGVSTGYDKSNRNMFIHLELPPSIPGWARLKTSYEQYKGCFDENGKLDQIKNMALTGLTDYNAFWILDWMAYLLGEAKYSLFSKLTQDQMDHTTLIFTHNSKCLLFNIGLLKGWLDDLDDITDVDKIKVTPKRINVTKRILLVMLTLINDNSSNLESDIKKEYAGKLTNSDTDYENKGEGNTEEGTTLSEDFSSKIKNKNDSSNSDSISSLFVADERDNPDTDDTKTGKGVKGHTEVDKRQPNHEEEGIDVLGDTSLDWTDDVDDKLLEEVKIDDVVSASKDTFKTPMSGIELALKAKAKDGTLTVAEQDFYLRKGSSYKTIKLSNGQTVEQFMKIDDSEIKNLDGYLGVDIPNVIDKSMLSSKATELKSGYVKKFLKKDIINAIMGLQNAGICITGLEDEEIVNANGAYYVYKVQTTPINGSAKTSTVRVPRVDADGSFTVDGVKLTSPSQRMEIPIRKINPSTVALTSYYDKKLMIRRSGKVVDDHATWLVSQIKMNGEGNKIKVELGNVYDSAVKSPRTYSILAKSFKRITAKGYVLNFDYNSLVKEHPEVSAWAKEETYPIGWFENKPIVIDEYGNVDIGDKPIDTIEGLLGVDNNKAPIETVLININGYNFPIGVVLCFYFGIDELLKVLKSDYRVVPMGDKPNLTDDEFLLKFSDEHLIFNKRDKLNSFIFGGLRKLPNLGNFSKFDLNSSGVWIPIIGDPKVRPAHFKEMKNIFDLFIDPITKKELERLKYPTSLHHLLISAVNLLKTDYAKNETSIDEQRIVGYERFSGHVYRELIKATRQYRNKPTDRKNALDLNPEAITMAIITDLSVNLVEEVNPVHQIKDQEETTFGGTGGRNVITMTRKTRGQQANYTGIISEAGKDSSKVGFIQYMTSDPKVVDYRGNIDTSIKETNTSYGSVVMNLFAGSTNDSPVRVLYTGTQASQGMSANNYTTNSLRTGYDTVLAHRTSELYSKVAKQSGVVSKNNKDGLVVTYEDGTEDSYPLGLALGLASGEVHRHTRVTDLNIGDSFNKGDIIGWDEQFFERDIGCPNQVAWKCGAMVRISLMESQFTFDDSFEISLDFAKASASHYIKSKRFMLDFGQLISWKIKVGDEVDYESILCNIEDPHVAGIDEEDILGEFDDLNKLGIKQVKSNHHGKIIKIDVTYNGDTTDMSDSVRDTVLLANKDRATLNKYTNTGVVDGNIGGNTNVKKTPINPGKVEVIVYIEDLMASTTADKFVVGNQMKGTTGNVFNGSITTLDGRRVDLIFSCKAMYNRMVLSLRDKLAVNELGNLITKEFIKIYRT